MKTESVQITLPSTNYDDREHCFNVTVQDGKLMLSTLDGSEFAYLEVETMTKDVKDDDGDYHAKPSKNFFVSFHPLDGCYKNIAHAWEEALTKPVAVTNEDKLPA